jgi:hypothetical protein
MTTASIDALLAENRLAPAALEGASPGVSRAGLLELCADYTRAERDCFTAWCKLADGRATVPAEALAASQAQVHEAAERLREACLGDPMAAYVTRRDLLTAQVEGEENAEAAVRARRGAEERGKIRTSWNGARWEMLCQRDALTIGLGWPHRGEWVTVSGWQFGKDCNPVPVTGDGIYLHDNDVYKVGHVVWLPALSRRHRDGHLYLWWGTDIGPAGRWQPLSPADPAGDIGMRLRDEPARPLPAPVMRWPRCADAGLPGLASQHKVAEAALFDVTSGLVRKPAAPPPPRPRRAPVPVAEPEDTLF